MGCGKPLPIGVHGKFVTAGSGRELAWSPEAVAAVLSDPSPRPRPEEQHGGSALTEGPSVNPAPVWVPVLPVLPPPGLRAWACPHLSQPPQLKHLSETTACRWLLLRYPAPGNRSGAPEMVKSASSALGGLFLSPEGGVGRPRRQIG